MARFIGLNSGSSFDSTGIVLVEIENGPNGSPGAAEIHHGLEP